MATHDRGFASMAPQKQREIARKGGIAAHEKGTAHEWSAAERVRPGRKGGIASHKKQADDEASPAEPPPVPESDVFSSDW